MLTLFCTKTNFPSIKSSVLIFRSVAKLNWGTCENIVCMSTTINLCKNGQCTQTAYFNFKTLIYSVFEAKFPQPLTLQGQRFPPAHYTPELYRIYNAERGG